MKVLWITNILLPPISQYMGSDKVNVGGWMFSALQQLCDCRIEFVVATVAKIEKSIEVEIDGIKYYVLPERRSRIYYDSSLEKEWKYINQKEHPDVVHIHGSEYQHGHAWINACGNTNVVLSFQGILSAYSRYYFCGLEGLKNPITLRKLLHRGTLNQERKEWERRSKEEIIFLKKINNYIGRTEWDRVHGWAINPKAKYYFCGETLRPIFYQHKWNYDRCQPHTIFLSQATYPIKGFQNLLKALPLILRVFPDTKVKIAGTKILATPKYRRTDFAAIISQYIVDCNLESHIEFLGSLSEEDICKEYLKANVFVCPSSIENSPNSLGEAQLLGMPIVAAYVGGIPEIMENALQYVYRFEEFEMLAAKICMIFEAEENFHVPNYILDRYDPILNRDTLIKIYKNVDFQILIC